jgi:hypothetical protein
MLFYAILCTWQIRLDSFCAVGNTLSFILQILRICRIRLDSLCESGIHLVSFCLFCEFAVLFFILSNYAFTSFSVFNNMHSLILRSRRLSLISFSVFWEYAVSFSAAENTVPNNCAHEYA